MVFKLSLVLLTTFLAVFRSLPEIRSLPKIEIYPLSSTTPWLYNNLFKFSSSSFEIAQPNLTYLFVSRSSRYSHAQPIFNLDSSHRVLYLLFVIASDCSLLNPGPVKLPCGICAKPVKCNQRAIECEECLVWFHVNCIALSTKSYADHCNDSNLVWICNLCYKARIWKMRTAFHRWPIILTWVKSGHPFLHQVQGGLRYTVISQFSRKKN